MGAPEYMRETHSVVSAESKPVISEATSSGIFVKDAFLAALRVRATTVAGWSVEGAVPSANVLGAAVDWITNGTVCFGR